MGTVSRHLVLFFLAGFFFLPGSSRAQFVRDSLDERRIELAAIDTHSVSLGLFKKSYVDYLIATGAPDTRENRYGHLQYILDAYLLGDYARENGLAQDSAFVAFEKRKRKEALGGRYYEIHVLDQMEELTDAERRKAFAYYNDKVHIRQLYFTNKEDAQAAYDRLEQGEDFITLANEVFQTEAFDSTAGDMGIISYFEVDDALAEVAFSLTAKHEYSEPVQSRGGFHILRLENRYTNPMITESAYEAHGKGVGEDMQLRKIRLKGDAFVRSFMDSLHYRTNTPAVEILVAHVKAMTQPQTAQAMPPGPQEEITAEELASVQTALTPETVLVEYEWEGQQRVFTAADYFAWLPSLPYRELKRNPAASVGRALRNEVFGLAGERDNLDQDPIVRESIYFESQLYLARDMKIRLRQDSSQRPSEEMVYQAYERLAKGKKQAVFVDYWIVPCTNFEEAEVMKSQIEHDAADPSVLDGYTLYKNKDSAQDPEWMSYLRQAPVDRPMIVGLEGGRWYILNISGRVEKEYAYEDVRASLETQLTPYAAEYFMLNRLYESTPIHVDTTYIESLVRDHPVNP